MPEPREQIEAIRLTLAKQEKCALPCACYRNPQKGDCKTRAAEIFEALAAL